MEKKLPDILAPAGDMDCAKAAILAGADALYIGLRKFNARERAVNIGIPELKEIISIAHARNVKVYVTMNTLLTEAELPEAFQTASEIYSSGADALIVQDPGLIWLLHQYIPDLELHASTQMTTHNCCQLDYLKSLGIKNVNFARELSCSELKKAVSYAGDLGIRTEIFVHGAYCISCSGICYMSSFISAQAGNRGKCLQPCRRRYSLKPGGEKKYFFSLKDNNALDNLEQIMDSGAEALKIEGRIKNYSYVYTTVSAWREHLDSLLHPGDISFQSDVSKVFNRGFSTGYFDGRISPAMFVESPLDQAMVQAGTVLSFNADQQILTVDNKCADIEVGARINIYTAENAFVCGAVVREAVDDSRFFISIENLLHGKILRGQLVTLFPEPSRMAELKTDIDSLKAENVPFDVAVSGSAGQPLKAVFSTAGRSVTVESAVLLENAKNVGLTLDNIKEQFEKTGGQLCVLGDMSDAGLQPDLFLPVRELNRMRREGLERLFTREAVSEYPVKKAYHFGKRKAAVLVSSPEDAMLFADKADFVFMEVFPGMDCGIFNEKNHVYPWFPPFIPDSQVDFYISVLEQKPEYLVSDNAGLGLMTSKYGCRWIAGPMLNSANSFAFEAYSKSCGAWGGFMSDELNEEQLADISAPGNFSVFMRIFGPVTMMTTRQCLLASAGRCRSGRNMFTDECVRNCHGWEKFYDEKNIPFHIVKSRGYVNRVFNDSVLFLPEACSYINADYFLVDLRSFPFCNYTEKEKMEIFDFFRNTVQHGRADRNSAENVKKIAGKVTRGNYQRGF